jgi:signal transduction histidine kinase
VRKQAEEALTTVSYKVIEAEEKERQRIAKDLHEGIGQNVTLLVIEIEQLKADSLDGAEMARRRADKRFALPGRYSSEIRTGCANERPSGSVRGAPGNWCPYRDQQACLTVCKFD